MRPVGRFQQRRSATGALPPAGDEAMWRTWLTRVAQAAGVVQAGVGQTGRRGAGGRAAGGGAEAPAPRVSEG